MSSLLNKLYVAGQSGPRKTQKEKQVSKNVTFNISGIWTIAWLFTIGIAELSFGQGVLAIAIWPYYIGEFVRNYIY